MDLRKRLARLDRHLQPGRSRTSPASEIGGEIAAEGCAERPLAEACAELGLDVLDLSGGRVWQRERRDDLPPPSDPLPDLRGFFTGAGNETLAPSDLIFLDTETTGLAGGTGTIAFLTGVSWWDGKQLHTRQYFLPGPADEGAMLAALCELAASRRAVVTFNGASFDLPLLRTRYLLNRLAPGLAHLQSWDLLVASRRLFGRVLADCRQQTVEGHVGGCGRGSDDIDGSRIPQVWFDFLHEGRVGMLPAVLHHNHWDMVGMALILKEAVRWADLSARGPLPAAEVSGPQAWSLARISEMRGQSTLAQDWMKRAVAKGNPDWLDGLGGAEIGLRFWKDALRILKRTGDWSLVETTIVEGVGRFGRNPWLHREAAILYEHRLNRLDKALDHAIRSGEPGRVRRLRRRLRLPEEPSRSTGRGHGKRGRLDQHDQK